MAERKKAGVKGPQDLEVAEIEKMRRRLRREKAPHLPAGFTAEVENRIQGDISRRSALLFLEKRPFKEWCEIFEQDKDVAVAFADVAFCLGDAVERYKGLVEILEAARLRMMVALCHREDAISIMDEVRHGSRGLRGGNEVQAYRPQ